MKDFRIEGSESRRRAALREKGSGPSSDIEVAEQLLRSIKNLMSMKRLAETASRSARRLRSLGRKDVAGSLERMVPGL